MRKDEHVMRVLVLSAAGFEDSELTEPVNALGDAGIQVDIASLEAGTISGKKGAVINDVLAVGDTDSLAYDMLLLPGGKAPARLRDDASVLACVKDFMSDDRPVAAICHGPQLLVSAGVVRDREMTSYESVGDELREAGAYYCSGN